MSFWPYLRQLWPSSAGPSAPPPAALTRTCWLVQRAVALRFLGLAPAARKGWWWWWSEVASPPLIGLPVADSGGEGARSAGDARSMPMEWSVSATIWWTRRRQRSTEAASAGARSCCSSWRTRSCTRPSSETRSARPPLSTASAIAASTRIDRGRLRREPEQGRPVRSGRSLQLEACAA
ncbi:hypothetical protein BDA96_07G127300 [Sorghum bicolor]|uniref:Uncharacterized protein n=1 Tax=Sorghum bicolor TaxID=4558 RepID=A0A921U9Q7_SORBI|nr:hypothetical protein BDA96_07G127300 [Sorghum bicolor]